VAKLRDFIQENTERILAEWETFVRGLAVGDSMDIAALRDHGRAESGFRL